MASSAVLTLSSVVHEIKNMLLLAQLCASELRGLCAPEGGVAYEDLQLAIARAAELSHRILGTVPAAGTTRARCDLVTWLPAACDRYARLFRGPWELVTDVCASAAPVAVPLAVLDRVLLNLLLNAREAMPAGGTAVVRLEASASTVQLSVRDSGVGVDGARGEQLGQPFSSSKRHDGHAGLGLYTVREDLRVVGGMLALTSSPGEGATFVVTLPREVAPAAEAGGRSG